MAVLACSVPKLDYHSLFGFPLILTKTLFHSHFDLGAFLCAGSIHIDAKKCHFSSLLFSAFTFAVGVDSAWWKQARLCLYPRQIYRDDS